MRQTNKDLSLPQRGLTSQLGATRLADNAQEVIQSWKDKTKKEVTRHQITSINNLGMRPK